MKIILILNFIVIICMNTTYSFICLKSSSSSNTNNTTLITSENLSDCNVKGEEVDYESLNQLCSLVIQNETTKIPLSLITIQSEITNIKSYYNICHYNASGIIGWIDLNDKNSILNGFDVEGYWFVGRNFINNVGNTSTYEYCIMDFANNGICRPLLESKYPYINTTTIKTEILIEKLPIRYELKDIKYSSWKNISGLITVVLNQTTLTNYDSVSKYIENDIMLNYNIQTEIIFPKNFVRNTQVNILHENQIISTFLLGNVTELLIHKNINVIKNLDSLKTVTASIEGTWFTELTELTGTIILIYENDSRITQNTVKPFKTSNIETSLADIIVIYGDTFDVEKTTLITIYDEENTTNPATSKLISTTETTDSPPVHKSSQVYPGFKSFFIIACIIFFSVVIIVIVDITRRIRKNKQQKRAKRRNHN